MTAETNAVVLCIALNPAIDLTIGVPHLVPGEVNRAERAQQDAGGKAINVASCLADHDIKVAVGAAGVCPYFKGNAESGRGGGGNAV